jgi:hypothetical protein
MSSPDKSEEKKSVWGRGSFLIIMVMAYILFFRYLIYVQTHTPIPPPSEWQSKPGSPQ